MAAHSAAVATSAAPTSNAQKNLSSIKYYGIADAEERLKIDYHSYQDILIKCQFATSKFGSIHKASKVHHTITIKTAHKRDHNTIISENWDEAVEAVEATASLEASCFMTSLGWLSES